MNHKEVIELIKGQTEEIARKIIKENGFDFRISQEDGVDYMLTCDLRLDRMNVVIEKGIITNAEIG